MNNNNIHQLRNSFNEVYTLIGSSETLPNSIPDIRICRFVEKTKMK